MTDCGDAIYTVLVARMDGVVVVLGIPMVRGDDHGIEVMVKY